MIQLFRQGTAAPWNALRLLAISQAAASDSGASLFGNFGWVYSCGGMPACLALAACCAIWRRRMAGVCRAFSFFLF